MASEAGPSRLRHWAAAPGLHGAALARIVVATSLLLVLRGFESVATRVAAWPAELYDPVGPARLLPEQFWTSTAVTLLLGTGSVAAILALVGRWSRTSLAVAWSATILVASAQYSWGTSWSHGENLTFLVGLPLLFVPTGAVWSLDARLGANAERADSFLAGAGVRASQSMVAVYFGHAAYSKLTRSGLEWAFSDNLAQIIRMRFDVLGVGRTPAAALVLDHPWLTSPIALGNLIAQAAPLLLLPFLLRRWARVVATGVVLAEAAGLTLLMGLFHGEMLPLGLLFLAGEGARRTASVEREQVAAWTARQRATALGLSLLVAAQVAVSLQYDDRGLRAYPLTAVPMYSYVLDGEVARLLIETSPDLPADEHRRLQEEDTLVVGSDTCRLLRRLAVTVPEVEAVTQTHLQQVTVSERRWDTRAEPARNVGSATILGPVTPAEIAEMHAAGCD